LKEEKTRNSSKCVKPEVEADIVDGNAFDILVSHSSFDKTKDNFNAVNDVDCHLNVFQSFL
jgi:hypothetical protein